MAYRANIKKYLRNLQAEYNSSITGGQHTAELSFRTPMDQLFRDLSEALNPSERIRVILEPRSQGKNVGRPDWRVHNEQSLGIYGYIEGKGLSEGSFDIFPYQKQIKKYLTLGHKLIISDGIDFVFCFKENQNPVVVSLIKKTKMNRRDWSLLEIDPRFEMLMRDFFNNPSPQQCSEEKLVELVAVRTRVLANDIMEYSHISYEEALDENERQIITLLDGIKAIIYNHNDPDLRTSTVFADFVAQVIMFSLLYAHRVLCSSTDSPIQKEAKIKKIVTEDFVEGEALTPFRSLMAYIRDHSDSSVFINQWVDECIKFLSFVQMTKQQLLNPDYHQLFELFLSRYDAQSRFDYGAYYTPKVLADYVVRLTNYIVEQKFSGISIYDDGNTIIDPCCGTGSFLEEVIAHDSRVDTVICATDAGREGELIFRLVYEKAKCKKPVKRLWISSLEDSAITKGFENLKDGKEYENIYQAALCRAKADWIVGINATRLFSVLYGQTLNIGRVLSPTLAMICERDAAISVFKPEPFYTVHLACNGFSLIGEKQKDKAQAAAILQACDGQSVTIESVEQKEKTENPPKLYDLTTLQREANKLLGFTAEQTLQYAQSLYEKKYITYPRTDSRFLTEDMENGIPVLAKATAAFFMPKEELPVNTAQVIDSSKVSDHHAIIPTMNIKGLDVQSLPAGERETLLLLAIRLLVVIK